MSEAIRRCKEAPHRHKIGDETTRCFASRYTGGLHFVTVQPVGVKHILVPEHE